ncbi:MAG: RNA methyltransferase [Parasporobacterium sp.]|nr:RNA methyltransferase [Parasporobacterium sp.]
MADIIEIEDFGAPEMNVYARLNERELYHYYEPEPGIFIAESPKVISRALDAGYPPVSFLMDKKQLDREAKTVFDRCEGVPVYTAKPEILKRITGFALTRGVLCAMRRIPLPDAAEICRDASRVAVLENIMNPTNVGAIFRSAAALGMDAVLLTEGCSDPLYRRSARVSMGTVFQIPWGYLPAMPAESLKAMGFHTAAMALDENAVNINDGQLMKEERLAIFLGSEGDGLSKETIAACDHVVKIPMYHDVDSLNVAAASAVAFWQLSCGNRKK